MPGSRIPESVFCCEVISVEKLPDDGKASRTHEDFVYLTGS